MARATPTNALTWRDKVAGRYGGPIPDPTWEWLEQKSYVRELEGGWLTIDDVVDEIRMLNSVAPLAISRLTRRIGASETSSVLDDLNERMQAVAEIVAARAERSVQVQGFRRRWVPNGLIPDAEVPAWIDAAYRRHLPKSWPTDNGPSDATNFPGKFALWPHPHLSLQWVDNAAGTVKVWCVPHRGPLGALAELSDQLVANWDWHAAFATNFVLTGDPPPRPGVRGVSFRTRRGFDDRYGPYDYMMVRASIDIEVTPEELATWWRGVRAHLGISGRKPIRQKAVRLATFALSRDDKTTYRQDMEAWNAEVPVEWRFDDWRNFRTAGHKAIEALNRPAADCHQP
jgi:hypothetical protein